MNISNFWVISILILLTVSIGALFSTRVLESDLSINRLKLINDIAYIPDKIIQHQRDAIYLPYKARLLVFNESVYGLVVLKNIASFWNLHNINQTILLANLYPIILGLVNVYKNKKYFILSVLSLICVSLVIGINKMVDARSSVIFLWPIFIFLFLRGISKVKWRLYLTLLVISLILIH